jgi:hypothetical protein
MRNDLRALPFRAGQLHSAQNYYEAAGILAAIKAGVAPASLARPMRPMRIERIPAGTESEVVATNGNGHATGHTNGHSNGNGNGNGKTRRSKTAAASAAATTGEVMPELLIEVGGE